MTLRDLIDALIDMETQAAPHNEVYVLLDDSKPLLLEGTGHDNAGRITLFVSTPEGGHA